MGVDTQDLRAWARNLHTIGKRSGSVRMLLESADEIDALRSEVDLLTKQRDAARRGMESAVMVAELAWDGEIPSPLPFHKMMGHPDDLSELDAAEMSARDIDCPCCGGSGHMDDVSEDVTVLRWTRYDGTEWAKLGDEWALLPAAPQAGLVSKKCKACFGSGVRDDGRWGGIADTTPCLECGGTGAVATPAP